MRTVCLPVNEDITLTSTMKSRDERVTTKDSAPNSNSLLRDAIACAGVLRRLYGFWVPCSGPVSTLNGKFLEGHSRTVESKGGAEVDIGFKCVHNGQVSAVYSNGAKKSETHIDTLDPASTGAPFPGKMFFRTQVTW